MKHFLFFITLVLAATSVYSLAIADGEDQNFENENDWDTPIEEDEDLLQLTKRMAQAPNCCNASKIFQFKLQEMLPMYVKP